MTTQAPKLITAEELFKMGDIGRCELIHSRMSRRPPGFVLKLSDVFDAD